MKAFTIDAPLVSGRDAAGPAPIRERIRSILRGLQVASADYGLKERHLTVLEMLGSFLHEIGPGGEPIVFASNMAMSERARGMDIQRIQRVMRDLVEKRLVIRKSSPNGKRYVRRDAAGQIRSAFGIDLSPLFDREAEIRDAHNQAVSRNLLRKMLRDELSLLRMSFTPESDEDLRIRAVLRSRSATVEAMEELLRDYSGEEPGSPPLPAQEPDARPADSAFYGDTDIPDAAQKNAVPTPDASQIDMHHQRVIQNNIDKKKPTARDPHQYATATQAEMPDCIELAAACPNAMAFTPESDRDWIGLKKNAFFLAPHIGIPDALIRKAYARLGAIPFTATVLCLVERYGPEKIRNAAAYLTSLIADGSDYCAARFVRSTAKLQAIAQ